MTAVLDDDLLRDLPSRCADYLVDVNLDVRSHAEIHELHEFFVDWFNATLENTDRAFTRVERALHSDFSMVLPSGTTIDRDAVLRQIRLRTEDLVYLDTGARRSELR